MDQNTIIAIIAFVVAIQLVTRMNAGPKLGTFVAVVLPYILGIVLKWIQVNALDLPIAPNLFSPSTIVTFALQLILSYIVLRKIREEEDTTITIGWAMSGFIVIIFLVPFVVQKIV